MSKAYRRDSNDPKSIFVSNIILCKGTPFYGFHVGYKPFLKISMLNPSHMTKLADLLRTGVIMNTVLQPYESHIPYIPQFFADFNLYGCGWIKLSDAYFREPVAKDFWRQDDIKILKPKNGFDRVSFCALEVDATPNLIMNRLDIQNYATSAHNSNDSRMNLTSLQELWRKESERRHLEGTSSAQFTPKVSSVEFTTNSSWSNLPDLMQELQNLIKDSQNSVDGTTSFNEISKRECNCLPSSVPTAFSTVDMFSLSKRLADQQRVVDRGPQTDGTGDGSTSDGEEEAGEGMRDGSDDDGESSYKSSSEEEDHNLKTHGITLKRPASVQLLSNSFKTHKPSSSSPGVARPTFSYCSPSFESSFTLSQKELLNSFVERRIGRNAPPGWLQRTMEMFRVNSKSLVLSSEPMRKEEVSNSLEEYGLPQVDYTEPYYSQNSDVPNVPMTFAGIEFRLKGAGPEFLEFFEFSKNVPPFEAIIDQTKHGKVKCVEMLNRPPTRADVVTWLQKKRIPEEEKMKKKNLTSQIAGPTQAQLKDGLTLTEESVHYRLRQNDPKNMMAFSMEIHASGRNGLLPDPSEDRVDAIFWKVLCDEQIDEKDSGVITSGDAGRVKQLTQTSRMEIAYRESEMDMVYKLIEIVRAYDPDILTGYEVQKASWGYLIERCTLAYDFSLTEALSRVRTSSSNAPGSKWGLRHTTDISITGRHVLNLWRVLRNEVNLLQYTLENVVFNVFKERIPRYSNSDLSNWFHNGKGTEISVFMRFYNDRVDYNLRIIVSQELISRYSEQARLIGIDYYSVFYRGSQFKVESLLARLAKRDNYIMISPSKKQVGQQNALEYIPLVMEPETRFYTSPVLVLDFQSLYPSIVIAYNYCYSTCLGRITPWRGRNKMGVIDLDLEPGLVSCLKDNIVVAPNGMIYVKPQIRKSTLSGMLSELLDSRMVVKEGMNDHKTNVAFQKSMNNRQLALKLTANVTYGYTSATYSGRMPCAEIADSIVLSGREILEDAIHVIQSTEKWGAHVVYGDTDSIFVHLPGKSREQAFAIGEEISSVITSRNKAPIKLKFEKVYHPCVLLAKKRYVGYMYEKRTQSAPIFDAKGTETVRRDGTPAEQKIEEKALRVLFETMDLSVVKRYLEEQWGKIIRGSVSIQDFLFSKEVKLGIYKKGSEPAGALVSLKNMEKDKRSEPQYKERVPYVVISGPPGSRLADRCVDPEYLLSHPWAQLDAEYYITKNLIPPLERIFNLMGADIRSWYNEMPKQMQFQPVDYGEEAGTTLRFYMKSSSCVICGVNSATDGYCCASCIQVPVDSTFILQTKIKERQSVVMDLEVICRNCASIPPASEVRCISGDCPIYYSRIKGNNQLKGYLAVKDDAFKTLNW
ncbi:hypothetical protein TRICI_000490 [Trichomonascus ciferrii]|uniref:DNA polymerase n=1 Tax=Trichomonascus ciferrii TaxID=44093 RepID=A0A642VDC2_9ASCO|nr:hypothetical protein TRICI_000490 [Trichomonascus ciferrii]